MAQNHSTRIEVKLPEAVCRQLDELVQRGWFRRREDVIDLALRKFLNTHRPELLERFIREDVEWGLRGGQ
jgi:Arc/MetJ-type ribon-helix-helix transcriptional regulator